MPTFVLVYENILEMALGVAEIKTTDKLNERLKYLQESGARIKDVKVSLSAEGSQEYRTYLIIYEAEKPIDLKKMYEESSQRISRI
jgi:hypothetical protein